jgi:uncharacterized protein YjbI with pentapeptide repeats
MPTSSNENERLTSLPRYSKLAEASPAERIELVLEIIQGNPEGRLELPARAGQRAILKEVCLGRTALKDRLEASDKAPPWWSADTQGIRLKGADLQGAHLARADLQHADLREADLRGAVLRGADLRGAVLEGAKLCGADFAGADLRGAALGEADFQQAMLEDANLQGAGLRFANFGGAILEAADLGNADLWGATFENAVLTRADLRGAILKEANLRGADLTQVNLQGAILDRADFRGACLRGVDFQGTTLGSAILEEAILTDTRLQGTDLTMCSMAGVHLSGARLERTRLRQEQLGAAIGEERMGRYEDARMGYLALERNFVELGDPDAAAWAYGKKRRMEKLQARKQAVEARAARKWAVAAGWYAKYAGDQAVEWLCDYGGSVSRVLFSLLGVFLLFTLIYGLSDGVVRTTETPTGPVRAPTRNPVDWVIFSMSSMSPTAKHPAGLLPRNEWIQLLASIQTFLGIALAALVGFVFGNTSRR